MAEKDFREEKKKETEKLVHKLMNTQTRLITTMTWVHC